MIDGESKAETVPDNAAFSQKKESMQRLQQCNNSTPKMVIKGMTLDWQLDYPLLPS
jgi:hypothetical protein